jgi:Asp-tRNA(Asn)/Glu-tRNA(Gln) amidotransferase A subunit family amidase
MSALLQPGLHGAFVAEGFGGEIAVARTSGRLEGLRLAVKDVFEVEGLRMGAGNPRWWAGQVPARSTALIVRRLLEAGAHWVGKTVTDELAYSLAGINLHYGTPQNPADAARLPGGSSSGSVVAVAAGHADIGLGSDCGGSCRLPASYCGVWGIRPTQGRLPKNGAFSLAHSFDTAGWFTRDGETMARVFAVLAHSEIAPVQAATFLTSEDMLAPCDPALRGAFADLCGRLAAHAGLKGMAPGRLPLAAWARAHRTLQAAEIAQQHGAWVAAHGNSLARDVKQRFDAAMRITPNEVAAAEPVRMQASLRLASLFNEVEGAALILMPTVPSAAPALSAPSDVVDAIRERSQQLLCIAGLAGLPQVSVPWAVIDGAPVGLSIVGPRHADASVIGAARWLQERLGPRAFAGRFPPPPESAARA